jgi:hypothetical protein
MAVAQKFLRHSDVRLSIHTYGHLDVEDVREGMSRSFTGAKVNLGTAPGTGSPPAKPKSPSRRTIPEAAR